MTAVIEPYDLDRLARAAVTDAPPLTAAQIERLRNVLAPALRAEPEPATVVSLPSPESTEAPGRAAA